MMVTLLTFTHSLVRLLMPNCDKVVPFSYFQAVRVFTFENLQNLYTEYTQKYLAASSDSLVSVGV